MFSDVNKALRIDNSGNVEILRNEEALRQAIELNIAALRGEYVRSTRGSELLRFIGRPFTESNMILLRQEIENIMANLDDRITNYYVVVNPNIDAGTYDISIQVEVSFSQQPMIINTRIRNSIR